MPQSVFRNFVSWFLLYFFVLLGLCSLFSVRTRMAMYTNVIDGFSWNFVYRLVWGVGSLWLNPFFEIFDFFFGFYCIFGILGILPFFEVKSSPLPNRNFMVSMGWIELSTTFLLRGIRVYCAKICSFWDIAFFYLFMGLSKFFRWNSDHFQIEFLCFLWDKLTFLRLFN